MVNFFYEREYFVKICAVVNISPIPVG